jgi:hypothetical protein
MKNAEAIGDWSVSEDPREAVSEHVLAVDSDVAIPITVEAAGPFEASVGHPDKSGEETFGGRGNRWNLSTPAHPVVIAAAYGAGVDTAFAAFNGTSGSLHGACSSVRSSEWVRGRRVFVAPCGLALFYRTATVFARFQRVA